MYTMEAEQASIRPPPALRRSFEALPGWELVGKGLEDLAAGRMSVEAALVLSARERLTRAGIGMPATAPAGEGNDLYQLVVEQVGDARAHARYNALRRRLSSFLAAAATTRAPAR